MKTVFIYGITGDIGNRVALILRDVGYTVAGVARKKNDVIRLNSMGMKVVQGDIASASAELQQSWLRNTDTVLFTAGAHSENDCELRKIDYEGVIKSAQSATILGIKSYILVSAFPEAGRTRETSPAFERYMHYKKLADAWLVNSDISWTILRPGRLTDAEPTGKVTAALALPYAEISRADFALFIADVIATGKFTRSITEVTGGCK